MFDTKYQHIFQKLPKQYAITNDQIRKSYQTLYSKLLDSFNKNDLHAINNLLVDSLDISLTIQLKYTISDDETTKDTFLLDFVNLLYSIITIYPIKDFKTQLSASQFLDQFLSIHKEIPNLTLPWQPYYKVLKYYTLNYESYFICGCNIPHSQFSSNQQALTVLLLLSLKISKYFPDEIEEEIEGKKILTNTTEQLVKKFIPKISPNGHLTPAFVSYLSVLCPPHKGRYKLYIDFILTELRNTSNIQCAKLMLLMISRSIKCNIEDDFTFLIPIISEMTSKILLKNSLSRYQNRSIVHARFSNIKLPQSTSSYLSEIIVALFISPSTRKSIIDLLESFFTSFKSICHPSVSSRQSESVVIFLRQLVVNLRSFLRKLRKKKENKIYFAMNKDLGPSEDEIHKFLSMISELKIMNIQNFVDPFSILIETQFNPSTIDHYFNIAFQCINLMDAYDVSCSGWIILTSLVMSIENNEIIRDNFETIFEIAASNLYRLELQFSIANFFTAVAFKIPFNKNDTAKGCEHFNFPKLAYSLFSNLMAYFRSLPCTKDELSDFDNQHAGELIETFEYIILLYSDNEVKNEILPIFTSLATDEDIAHSVFLVENIIYNYCYCSTPEQAESISNSAKKQLETSNYTASMFRFLAIIYAVSKISNSRTIESIKEVVYYLLPFTKSDNKKIRKNAWFALSISLGIVNRSYDPKVTYKHNKSEGKTFGYGSVDDFEIKWTENLDTSDLFYEIFDPVMEKFLTLTDPHEIKKLIKEVRYFVSSSIPTVIKYTEGQIEGYINRAIIDSIHVIPQNYVKSVPIRDKFIKCSIRIIKEFPENENLLTNIIDLCSSLFYPYQIILNEIQSFSNVYLNQMFKPMNEESIKYNPIIMEYLLSDLIDERPKFIVIPVTDDIIELLTCIAQLGTTKFSSLAQSISDAFGSPSPFYYPLIKSIITDMILKSASFPFNDFINFLNLIYVHIFLSDSDVLLCHTILVILNNLDVKEKENLYNLLDVMENICLIKFPFGSPNSNNTECMNLLKEIEEKHLCKYLNNRTYNHMLMLIIFMSLKRVYSVSDVIFDFIMKNITHFDQEISVIAEKCFTELLRRNRKSTKERIEIKKFPTVSDFPNILNSVTVKYKENGFYFPLTIKTTSVENFYENINEDDEEDDDDDDEEEMNTKKEQPNINSKIENQVEFKEEEEEEEAADVDNQQSNEYSLDINPTTSLEINYSNVEVDEDILRVFESFKNITIEWDVKDEEKIFDSSYLIDQSNGYLMFKDHYYQKKFEFKKDKFLLKNIPNILASAINSINEKDLKECVNYLAIWKSYSMAIGPYCIKKLTKISIKFMSQYFSMNAVVVAKIFSDVVCGFMFSCLEWSIEDRIKFIKQIALPIICILVTNPNTTKYADRIVNDLSIRANPFIFAPLIKVLYGLCPSGPNLPVNNRFLVSILAKQITTRPFAYFNLIDQYEAKFINPFIEKMNEYNLNEIVPFEKSPFYSKQIELYKKKSTEILNKILTNKFNDFQSIKKIFIKCLTSSFNNFNKSTYELRLLVAPIFIDNLNLVFNLLKGINISDEVKFINSIGSFIENNFFMTNSKIELRFISIFVNLLKKLSLPIQMVLLENINKMIENNIFNISKDDFTSYEKIFVSYDCFEKSFNFGTELRLKIAKILGIFEIRNDSFNKLIKSEVTDHNLIEELILKAASIILNSYLFDHADEKVTNAFDLMDERCTTKNSKDKDFFKNVSEIFIKRHTGHVLNEVEDLLIQYKSLLTPSYIS